MNIKPNWIKASAPGAESTDNVGDELNELGLNTVCREADCPNQGECWSHGTATFMLMGSVCTRTCRFCDVDSGCPDGELDDTEPQRLREAVVRLGLDYVVLTSVDRDDLKDGGAGHFRETVEEVKSINNPPLVEGLIPDFSGDAKSLELLAGSGLDVLGHNIETVERLSPVVRDRRASYELSLTVLNHVKQINPELVTKSSIMVGLGEKKGEVIAAMEDLRRVDVDIVTIGQYLRPTKEQLQVEKFWEADELEDLKRRGEQMGFSAVIAGSFVRSSYKAKETFLKAKSEN